MKITTISVNGAQPYDVCIGPDLLGRSAHRLRFYSRRMILCDARVTALYRSSLEGLHDDPCHVVAAGEASKSLSTLEAVLDAMAEAGLDRRSCLICLGGGVIGDLGGLAASLYMRGIAHVLLPTTLLAQVDASVGGKTAVNLRAGKNLAGTFHSPVLVIADTRTLSTLSDEEYQSGLGEVVKSALIEGEGALTALEDDPDSILRREPARLREVVASCVRTKAAIVERDPLEQGERKLLNLGHTFAHAIEHAAGYGTIPHGIAVAAGVNLALQVSRKLGLLDDAELPARVRRLCAALGLPAGLDELRMRYFAALEPELVISAMRRDKKAYAGQSSLVLPRAAGRLELDVEIAPAELEHMLEHS